MSRLLQYFVAFITLLRLRLTEKHPSSVQRFSATSQRKTGRHCSVRGSPSLAGAIGYQDNWRLAVNIPGDELWESADLVCRHTIDKGGS